MKENYIYIQPEQYEKANLLPIQNILHHGKMGEKKKIAALGASVSKGECVKKGNNYLHQIEQKWQMFFPGSETPEFINASQSGTFSANAMFLVDQLIEKKPDLVFLDFSVNDPGQYYLQESFEGLVHQFLEKGIYVCVLLFCNQNGHCTRGAMTRIAHYYHIPLLDIGSVVMKNIEEKRFAWEDYASDYVHPRIEGHEFIADNILFFFQEAWKEKEDMAYIMPQEPCFDGSLWQFEKLEKPPYDENQRFEIKRYCSLLMIDFFQTPEKNDFKVEIWVDGEKRECLELYSEFAWNNRVVRMILAEKTADWHQIQIQPAGQNEQIMESLKRMDIKFGIGCVWEDRLSSC